MFPDPDATHKGWYVFYLQEIEKLVDTVKAVSVSVVDGDEIDLVFLKVWTVDSVLSPKP